MKTIIFNLLYTLSFIAIFTFIVVAYTGYYVNDKDQSLPIKPFQSIKNSKFKEARYFSDFNIKADNISVLMYHRIINEKDLDSSHYDKNGNLHPTIVTTSEFEKQMKVLKDNDFVTLTLKEFQMFVDNKLEIPKNSVLITFDDGFKDNYNEAYKILKKNDFVAVNFIITSKITKKDSKYVAHHNKYMSIKDLQKSSDVFQYQSHTYNYHMRNKNNVAYLIAQDKNDIKMDLEKSFIQLDEEIKSFAYPYGEYNDKTIDILKELNVDMAFTTQYGEVEPGINKFEIPRKQIYPTDTIEMFKKEMKIKESKEELKLKEEKVLELKSFVDHNVINGWEIILNEEFEGKTLNNSYWTALHDGFGWGNRNQFYLPKNVKVKDGTLVIDILKEKKEEFDYTSGAVISKNKLSFKYGKIEVRAKLPNGKGIIPAIWMLPVSDKEYPEIDIAELIGQKPGELWNVVHSLDSNNEHVREYHMTDLGDVTNDFHTYGIEWDEEKIIYFFDGKEIFVGNELIPNEDMYLYLNAGVGGNWVGEPDEKTKFPKSMLIDYVRYYK